MGWGKFGRLIIFSKFLSCSKSFPPLSRISKLNDCGWLNEGLKAWISDFDQILGIHDRRLSLLVLAKFLTSPQKPAAISEAINEILPKCLTLFKGLAAAYEYRAAEEASDDGDSDDEDMDGDYDQGDDEEDDIRGNIHQLNDDESDVDEDNKAYIKMLENFKLEEENIIGETELEDYTTVIDEDGIPFEGLTKDSEGVVQQHDYPDEYWIDFLEIFFSFFGYF